MATFITYVARIPGLNWEKRGLYSPSQAKKFLTPKLIRLRNGHLEPVTDEKGRPMVGCIEVEALSFEGPAEDRENELKRYGRTRENYRPPQPEYYIGFLRQDQGQWIQELQAVPAPKDFGSVRK